MGGSSPSCLGRQLGRQLQILYTRQSLAFLRCYLQPYKANQRRAEHYFNADRERDLIASDFFCPFVVLAGSHLTSLLLQPFITLSHHGTYYGG